MNNTIIPLVVKDETESSFSTRKDNDWYREVITIWNERKWWCSFDCKECWVRDNFTSVTSDFNKSDINENIKTLEKKVLLNEISYQEEWWHICIYNNWNVTNSKEMSSDNLWSLLKEIDKINPKPEYVSLNSRGWFIKDGLLEDIKEMNLWYDIQFILWIETINWRGEIFWESKKNMRNELLRSIKKVTNFNNCNETDFWLDINLLFLPEFYLNEWEDRESNKEKIINGFLLDLKELINMWTNNFHLKINLHPYYSTKEWNYKNADMYMFFDVLWKIESILNKKQLFLDKDHKITLFIWVEEENNKYSLMNKFLPLIKCLNEEWLSKKNISVIKDIITNDTKKTLFEIL